MKRLKVRFHGLPEDIECFMKWFKSHEDEYHYQVVQVREVSRVYKDRQSDFSRVYVDFDFDDEVAVNEINLDLVERQIYEIFEK